MTPTTFLRRLLAAATAVLLATQAEAGNDKVLFFGIDGFKADAIPAAGMVNLERLIASGVYTDGGWAPDTSVSGPGWSTLFMGVERDKHGVRDNSFAGQNYARYPHFLSLIEQRKPQLVTAYAYNWAPLYQQMRPQADLRFDGPEADDGKLIAQAEDWLRNRADLDVLSTYYYGVDEAGHSHGFHSDTPQYLQAMGRADAALGRLLQAIRARPGYAQENWLVVVTTDHGGTGTGHGADRPEHRKVAMVMSGAGIPALGRNALAEPLRQVDVLPTLFEHLGVPTQGLDLDGRSRLHPQPRRFAYGRNLLANPGAEYGAAHSDLGYDPDIAGWTKGGAQTVMRYGARNDLPSGQGQLFVGLGKGSLTQRIALPADAAGRPFRLDAQLGASAGSAHDARVLLRFIGGDKRSAVNWNDDTAYFFAGDRYYRYDFARDRVAEGYPKPIAGNWVGFEGLPGGPRDLDAGFNAGNGKAYFFKGDQYLRFDVAADRVDSGYPKPIAGNWPGLERFAGGARDLDATLAVSGDKIYFFKGSQYLRYNLAQGDRADARYPLDLSAATWSGVQQWPLGVEAAFKRNAGVAYFFDRGEYIRYDLSADKAAGGYPQPVDAATWPGLEAFRAEGRFFASAPLGAAERTGQPLARALYGSVPEGATAVEVELRFEKGSGAGFPFADELNLRID
ncbi:hemopexin repeat-containing protein [Pseudomonas sp. RIT-PI-AD]|uniref:hemopexin repeat-containing protein n=1 Tax=Pseudomonas sp. RIT-PI-AD TaxID=3035294 RepID=UPI0021DAD595|nr:hemopexin repeat-containing protein [Pseudomonas sp. RIT-PI-AD]